MRTLFSYLVVASLANHSATAQTAAYLSRPDARLPSPFGTVRSVRELASGRLLVSDPSENLVRLVDLDAGTSEDVGRPGQGPGEYGRPLLLFPMPDGSTLLHDAPNRRLLVIGADGRPSGRTIALPVLTARGRDGSVSRTVTDLRGVDGQGRLYFQGPESVGGSERADSVAILRWDPGTSTALDTVAFVRVPERTQVPVRDSRAGIRLSRAKIFAPTELWGVDQGGRVVRAIPKPYSLAWYARLVPVSGPTLPYVPIRVTEADKAAAREAEGQSSGIQVATSAIGDGSRSGVMGLPVPEPEFAESHPPFTELVVAGDGEVWLLRSRAAADSVPSYDAFNRSGRLVRRVFVAPRSRVVGFGRKTVYVVRSDGDGLQYLERYRRP